ncbi:MLX-interacting protein-like isoform X2 [Sinocyclocheilus anshuiensis]|uniref:MLX-interacting protein-like isoform X2 n=1 Tax=Sinocyclocheilus anshuiensis TaxID=1608454 RepID=UPI0007B86F0F|nr:PREDICTED: MLX-interacting protein-like isoform X2 [Sinocyclocheilus anshuiensis]
MATREPRLMVKQEQDDDSDAEEPTVSFRRADQQIIHSGHFMVSSPHTEHPPKKGYDFDTVNKQTCQTYRFGKTSTSHFSIDVSLTKLFECMTLAYSGRLVSPKWKNFKGLKLLWRDKIRLNNAIWRAWYMQYVEKRQNPVCHFVTPLDGNMDSGVHRPTEAIATEGKYWKRRIEIVIREYHKWRTYFKKRLQKHKDEDLSSLLRGAEEQFSLFGEVCPDTCRVLLYQDEDVSAGSRRRSRRSHDSPVPMEMDLLFDMDMLMSEFSDTLFSTLASHQPVAWPNPREIAHAGNADMIQPGLIPLQPNLDFMDTFEPLQDLFHTLRPPAFPPTAPAVTALSSSSSQTQAPMLLSTELPSLPLDYRLIPSAPLPSHLSVANQDNGNAVGPSYQQTYMPLFPEQVTPSIPPPAPPVPAAPQPLQCGGVSTVTTVPSVPAPSVITHTAPSTVTPSDAATTFSHRSSFELPTAPSPQPAVSASLSSQPVNFALPKSILPPVSNKKARHPQRPIVPLPSPQLILTGPSSAVIVTQSPLSADVVPSTGMVIAPSSIPCGSAGFHILPQTQKSPQLIVPKEETATTISNNKTSVQSATHDGRVSGQGSPLGAEQVPSPQSPLNPCAGKNEASQGELGQPSKSRRVNHISAEQKRRFTINACFKTLCNLVPTLRSQSNISNAATLQKTVDYISKLQLERQQMQEETKRLREEIEELNTSISLCQEQLPDTGVPIARHRFDHMKEKLDDYVKNRTLQNWKFWIFSVIIHPLFESFKATVSTTNSTELCETTMQWLDRYCALPVLRPMVLRTLRQLCTSTSILTDPSLLPEEAKKAALNPKKHSSGY